MNASTPDIRVGDLVKATHSKRPESTFTGRVTGVTDYWVDAVDWSVSIPHHDFEVLDRPLPPIDEELLGGAVEAYLGAAVEAHPLGQLARKCRDDYYRHAVTAVINYLRANDNHIKENSK